MDIGPQVQHKVALIEKFPIFSGIPHADSLSIVSAAHEKRFARHKTLFSEGDPIREILLLVSGWVKETQFSQNGSEVILRLNGPGQIMGALGCNKGDHCSTAQTIRPSSALVWESSVFEACLEHFPVLRRNATQILGERLRELEQRFREVSTEKVAPRLSRQLVRLSNQLGWTGMDDSVAIHLSREELAQLTGTSLFTVSRLLCKWEALGFVVAQREVVRVRNLAALMQVSEGE